MRMLNNSAPYTVLIIHSKKLTISNTTRAQECTEFEILWNTFPKQTISLGGGSKLFTTDNQTGKNTLNMIATKLKLKILKYNNQNNPLKISNHQQQYRKNHHLKHQTHQLLLIQQQITNRNDQHPRP